MRLDEAGIRAATVDQIEAALEVGDRVGRRVLALLEQDPRTGVRRLAVRERERGRLGDAERRRLRRLRQPEARHWALGLERIAGVDEVGRGCLAGPVVAAAVVLPESSQGLERLDDSKLLDAATRARLRDRIAAVALDWAVAAVAADEIDRINILEASMKAMRLALGGLRQPPQHVLVDGGRGCGSPYPETPIIDGDARSLCIAAASVVAKEHRDALMVACDRQYPDYGFARNKGYASAGHRAALRRCGPCPLHRRSFSPIARRDPLTLELAPRPSTGADGEAVAAEYLRRQGYEILHRGYRAAGGEIDLVAVRDGVFVFAEVKTTRRAEVGPEQRVGWEKRRHLVRAARAFVDRGPQDAEAYRFDVLAVDLSRGTPRVEHIEDAFSAQEF